MPVSLFRMYVTQSIKEAFRDNRQETERHASDTHITWLLPLSVLRQPLWKAIRDKGHHREEWTRTSRLRCQLQMAAEKKKKHLYAENYASKLPWKLLGFNIESYMKAFPVENSSTTKRHTVQHINQSKLEDKKRGKKWLVWNLDYSWLVKTRF